MDRKLTIKTIMKSNMVTNLSTYFHKDNIEQIKATFLLKATTMNSLSSNLMRLIILLMNKTLKTK